VIPGAATAEHVFAESREEIEKLRNEDATILQNGGEDPNAHSGEEYRQELRKGLERYGDRGPPLPRVTRSGRIGAQLRMTSFSDARDRNAGLFAIPRIADAALLERFVLNALGAGLGKILDHLDEVSTPK